MKALRKTRPTQGLEICDIPIPGCGPGQILVKVKAAGICGTDVHIYEWTPGYEYMETLMPKTLGHEFAGEVAIVGEGVTQYKAGDRVFCRCFISCGKCDFCTSDRRHFCDPGSSIRCGFQYDGGFAEYCLMQGEQWLIPLPDGVSYEEAALIEPMGIAANAVNDAKLRFGDTCVIIGPGPIGIMTMLLAKSAGAGKCIMIGRKSAEKRMELAKELGADALLLSDDEDPVKAVMQLSGNLGADAVFECSGAPDAVVQGMNMTTRAGTVVLVGIYPKNVELSLTSVVRSAHRIIGTYAGEITWDRLLAWLDSDNPYARNMIKLISHKTSLKDADAAFHRCITRENIKELFVNFN